MTYNTKAYGIAERRFWMRTVGVVPMEHDVDLPGLGTRVRVLTHGVGPTIVFVHGGSSAASTWAPLVSALSNFRCVLIERPGCGLSKPATSQPRSIRAYAVQLLREVFDALGLDQPAIVASSFGSYATLAFAAEHPERVSRIVHLGAPALVPGARMPLPLLLAQTLPLVGSIVRRFRPPSPEWARRTFQQMGHDSEVLSRADVEDVLKWYTALSMYTPTASNDGALFGRIGRRDALSMTDLSSIRAPMSFFWGECDTFGTPDSARALATAIPNAHLEWLPGGGHLPWVDEPERAAEHVTTFMLPLRALSRGTRFVRARGSRAASSSRSSAILRVV
jgi:2-hydroxy-6-oxonona-2,4-dienedioate hydrolase